MHPSKKKQQMQAASIMQKTTNASIHFSLTAGRYNGRRAIHWDLNRGLNFKYYQT